MTLRELNRNLSATLGLALIAGREDDRWEQLGGNASMLLGLLQEAGGIEGLMKRCAAEQERADAAMRVRAGGAT